MHFLYKVKSKCGDSFTGIYGAYKFKDGVSQWMGKMDAHAALGSCAAVPCDWENGPYYAIMHVESHVMVPPLAENRCSGTWVVPANSKVTTFGEEFPTDYHQKRVKDGEGKKQQVEGRKKGKKGRAVRVKEGSKSKSEGSGDASSDSI